MSVTIDADRVTAFAHAWLDSADGSWPDVEVSDEERAVALVLVGYDTAAHAALVMPAGYLGPARRVAGELRAQGRF